MEGIHIVIGEKGIRDVFMLGNNTDGGEKVVALFHKIEPDLRAFEALIDEKLNPEEFVRDG